jgi:hypothetical protein
VVKISRLSVPESFPDTPELAAGVEILAFRSSATSSRHVKSFHDFILTFNPEGGGKTMMEDLKQTLKEHAHKVDQLRGYL